MGTTTLTTRYESTIGGDLALSMTDIEVELARASPGTPEHLRLERQLTGLDADANAAEECRLTELRTRFDGTG
ncbi:hypothetical protein [Paeniglutamicibacter cryotolerans]|uniref:Uncharacterized protein n=1 Tax=Paeniglutamicibacter cryotolerans TaxID=670079 RepID=A0A839R071_9MICC|nr:hypothetical protein [Paeniglutamicibacter cryotolerans]MBB2997641.1 hypothetical protein [Paeniglutamicibacter cryotolerans]